MSTAFRRSRRRALITSQALADRVLDDPIACDMLAGLDRIGLTGLGLVYDDLTVPVGFSAPLQSPQDFAGATITSRPSRGGRRRAEGARRHPLATERGDAVDAATACELDGTVDALEQPTSPVNGTATGNAALYLKIRSSSDRPKFFIARAAAPTFSPIWGWDRMTAGAVILRFDGPFWAG